MRWPPACTRSHAVNAQAAEGGDTVNRVHCSGPVQDATRRIVAERESDVG